MIDGPAAEELKRCCAAAYQHDAAKLLLGSSYHPGGSALTRRLASSLDLRPGKFVAEIASGPGTTALLLAAEFGVRVVGLELGPEMAYKAASAAQLRGLADRVCFLVADAESAPLRDGCVDALLCECALCTFPDKDRAAAEMARLVRPGGRVGLADVVLEPSRMTPELQTVAGWIACLAGAVPADEYQNIFSRAGLRVREVESHDQALFEMIEEIEARLIALSLAGVEIPQLDPARVRDIAAMARQAIEEGSAGYVLIAAEKLD